MIKETCAAVAAIITSSEFKPEPSLVNRCGTLLISTLTSLKHAGAAFSARDAFQEISIACLRSQNLELRSIPEKWANRLLDEMCSRERVRDSTLRRSTGYALGFGALMRAELVAKPAGSNICASFLRQLVKYSLPPESILQKELITLGIFEDTVSTDLANIFFSGESDPIEFLIQDSEYEVCFSFARFPSDQKR